MIVIRVAETLAMHEDEPGRQAPFGIMLKGLERIGREEGGRYVSGKPFD